MTFFPCFALLLLCNFYSYSNDGDNLLSSYRLFPSFSLFIIFFLMSLLPINFKVTEICSYHLS